MAKFKLLFHVCIRLKRKFRALYSDADMLRNFVTSEHYVYKPVDAFIGYILAMKTEQCYVVHWDLLNTFHIILFVLLNTGILFFHLQSSKFQLATSTSAHAHVSSPIPSSSPLDALMSNDAPLCGGSGE